MIAAPIEWQWEQVDMVWLELVRGSTGLYDELGSRESFFDDARQVPALPVLIGYRL